MSTKAKVALGVLVVLVVVAVVVVAMREPASDDVALADVSSGSAADLTAPRAVIPLPTGARVRAPRTKRTTERSNQNVSA